MPYYPDQRYALEMTTIQREQTLPEDAIGSVEVRQGASVNLRDIVARGILPSRYIMVDAAGQMRLKKSEDLGDILKVSVGDLVTAKEVLAEAPKGRRRVVAPVDGIVADINNGQIILQIEPETVELEAGLDGQVIRIQQGQGVVIETHGATVAASSARSKPNRTPASKACTAKTSTFNFAARLSSPAARCAKPAST